jgi:hypothetical protein
MSNFFKKTTKTKLKDKQPQGPKEKQGSSQSLSSENWETALSKSIDFKKMHYISQKSGRPFTVVFVSTLVDDAAINEFILPGLLTGDFYEAADVKKLVPAADVQLSSDPKDIETKLLSGYVMLTVGEDTNELVFIAAKKHINRSISPPEVEFSVIGPKEAFVESIDQNLYLIRKRLPVKELVVENLQVGKLSKTHIAVLYIDHLVDRTNVQTVVQRIKDIEFDEISDSSYIVQMISDNENSPFPQLLDSERPDRISAVLAEGKVAILVDGSPHALVGPTTLTEFYSSFEDYYLNWIISVFFRLIRFFSVIFSLLVTPVYVAVLTYHYELIPKDLLGTLITSRRVVPFPPILEALILELTIELLREAGARLPTKVGQTIGIVGGIVIGTASVEAGLTSNVLLIIIALAALASFTTPIYRMGNTIRLLRFPFLLMAELWGLVGILIGFAFLLTHLLRLTSLGRPYLEPLYPPRISDFRDAIVRLSFKKQSKRPQFLRTENTFRFSKKKGEQKKDIDE